MTKKYIILFVIISTLLIACSKNENQTSKPDSSEKNTNTQTQTISDNKSSETKDNTTSITEDSNMDNKILKDNKLIINTEKIKSIALRDGNTGETVLEVTDKDNIAKISTDISSVEFTEHAEISADGWTYEIIINADEAIHIVISGNSQIYISSENTKIDCETNFDLIGYIEDTLLISY